MNAAIEKQTRKPRSRKPVKVNVERFFMGEQSPVEAMIPVIVEDLRRKTETSRTFDKPRDTS